MNYQVQSGDCLWNIVQNQYGLKNDAEIANKVNEIYEANRQQGLMGDDINYITDGQSIFLPDDGSVKGGVSNADSFHRWGNSNDTGEFQMFDIKNVDAKTYAAELDKFAQGYIDKFDTDKDGSWNEQEFLNMVKNGGTLTEEQTQQVHVLFNSLNIDNDAAKLSSKEYASLLFAADDKNGQLDGKFSKQEYLDAIKLDTAGDANIKNKKTKFYENNYGKSNQIQTPTKADNKAYHTVPNSSFVDKDGTTKVLVEDADGNRSYVTILENQKQPEPQPPQV